MKLSAKLPARVQPQRPFPERAGTSPLVLVVVLLVGLAVGAWLAYQLMKPAAPTISGETPPTATTLAESTTTVLGQLSKPVNLRLYVLFSDDTVPAERREHSAWVNELVSELERYANGRLVVTRFHKWSRESTQSAAQDGVLPLTLPQGDPCYVGIAVTQDDRKEALPQLAPEWAAALEYDIARAIARVGNPPPAARSAEALQLASKADESVKQTISNPASTSLEDGKQILRNASLKAYQALVGEMNREVAKAEQLVQQATADAERQAALQKLQQVRTGYADKLREIALQSQAEMEAWTRLKGQ